ncbi:VF530 family protein [Aeromonas sp. MR16]|uniref:VF530 family protein n=1 Tax=Aeromonas sp. MR16 TaxID=2923420 RepID=UPI001F4B1FC2|nr:VF530 family protein [Aeromonas sp. MR16]MCH7373368.1 VF530 family protein [Aeromonas sp. MR16]
MSDQQGTSQPKNPLHGLTLEAIITALVAHYGWEQLGKEIDIRCFTQDPSIKSSLKFLRKTPWAREKVESLYLYVQRKQAKQAGSRSV